MADDNRSIDRPPAPRRKGRAPDRAGLLSSGGAIAGGLPLIRPDLHFLYNLVETVPLVAAFVWQLKHGFAEATD